MNLLSQNNALHRVSFSRVDLTWRCIVISDLLCIFFSSFAVFHIFLGFLPFFASSSSPLIHPYTSTTLTFTPSYPRWFDFPLGLSHILTQAKHICHSNIFFYHQLKQPTKPITQPLPFQQRIKPKICISLLLPTFVNNFSIKLIPLKTIVQVLYIPLSQVPSTIPTWSYNHLPVNKLIFTICQKKKHIFTRYIKL